MMKGKYEPTPTATSLRAPAPIGIAHNLRLPNITDDKVYYANYKNHSTINQIAGRFISPDFKEISIYDYFNLTGLSSRYLFNKTNLLSEINETLGCALVFGSELLDPRTLAKKRGYDYILQRFSGAVKLYHYTPAADKILEEGFKCDPWRDGSPSFAEGLYCFDFYPGEEASWGATTELLIAEADDIDYFKCFYDGADGTHESYTFVAYDFAKLTWRRPNKDDLTNPKYTTDKTQCNTSKYLQALENLTWYDYRISDYVIAYPFDNGDILEKITLALKDLKSFKSTPYIECMIRGGEKLLLDATSSKEFGSSDNF